MLSNFSCLDKGAWAYMRVVGQGLNYLINLGFMVSYIKKDALKLTIPINIIHKKREFSNPEKKLFF